MGLVAPFVVSAIVIHRVARELEDHRTMQLVPKLEEANESASRSQLLKGQKSNGVINSSPAVSGVLGAFLR